MELMEKKTASAIIQAEPATFKEVVQKLTGGSAGKHRPKAMVPFKLHQRRKQSLADIQIIERGSAVKGPVTPGSERVRTEEEEEEARAIAVKGFYLHASPTKSKPERPALLTLFPLTPQSREY